MAHSIQLGIYVGIKSTSFKLLFHSLYFEPHEPYISLGFRKYILRVWSFAIPPHWQIAGPPSWWIGGWFWPGNIPVAGSWLVGSVDRGRFQQIFPYFCVLAAPVAAVAAAALLLLLWQLVTAAVMAAVCGVVWGKKTQKWRAGKTITLVRLAAMHFPATGWEWSSRPLTNRRMVFLWRCLPKYLIGCE